MKTLLFIMFRVSSATTLSKEQIMYRDSWSYGYKTHLIYTKKLFSEDNK